jgi:hypothetical protein
MIGHSGFEDTRGAPKVFSSLAMVVGPSKFRVKFHLASGETPTFI